MNQEQQLDEVVKSTKIDVSGRPAMESLIPPDIGPQVKSFLKRFTELVYSHHKEPGPELSFAIKVAIRYINQLLDTLDFPPLSPEDLKIFIVEAATYQVLEQMHNQKDPSVGFYVPPHDFIVVRDSPEDTELEKAVTVFHELIHFVFDQISLSYWSRLQQKSSGLAKSTDRLELHRAGLSVKHLVRDELIGERIKKELIGVGLNEMVNYFLEIKFKNFLFSQPESKQFFSKAITDREVLTQKLMPNDEHFAEVEIDDTKYLLPREAIFADDNGELLVDKGVAFFQSLNLMSELCGKFQGQDLIYALLRAKSQPQLQNQIRSFMDSHLGEGMYKMLKRSLNTPERAFQLWFSIQYAFQHPEWLKSTLPKADPVM